MQELDGSWLDSRASLAMSNLQPALQSQLMMQAVPEEWSGEAALSYSLTAGCVQELDGSWLDGRASLAMSSLPNPPKMDGEACSPSAKLPGPARIPASKAAQVTCRCSGDLLQPKQASALCLNSCSTSKRYMWLSLGHRHAKTCLKALMQTGTSPLRSKRSLTAASSLSGKLAMLAIPEDDTSADGTIPAAKSPRGLTAAPGVSGLIEARRGSPGAPAGKLRS